MELCDDSHLGADVGHLCACYTSHLNGPWCITFEVDAILGHTIRHDPPRLRDGNADIYVMKADGTGLTNLTQHPANDYLPDWSLDGHHIAFTTERTSGGDIYVINADGTAVTRLTTNPELDDRADWGK